MNLAEFEKLLKEKIGLDAASIGSASVERAVRRRMTEANAADFAVYWEMVQGSPGEMQALVEAVVVPETWFFRDPGAFNALAKLAVAEDARRPLRLLSVPCSTGEEPYSMAMTLIGAGLQPGQFRIDAVDISEQNLTRARAGEYGRYSFRGHGLKMAEPYCETSPAGRRVKDAVRERVRFFAANLVSADFSADKEPYDFVFCRNLLIYFDRPTQTIAMGQLERVLAPGGVLFLGSAETSLPLELGFVSLRMPLAFAFKRKTADAGAAPEKSTPPPPPPPLPLARVVKAAALPKPAPKRSPVTPLNAAPVAPQFPPATDQRLDRAQRFADEGRLDEAAEICAAFLREQPASIPALYLLALVRDAAGELAAAREHYRQVIYLDPGHYEAMMHLASLTEKMGDAGAARLLRERARRVLEKQKKPGTLAERA